MKWAYHIKHKVKAAAVLLVILGSILLCNIQATNGFSTLDNSVSTIYRDRLQVSQYIYEISNALYQKRLLFDTETPKGKMEIEKAAALYNARIAGLVKEYEKTVLTSEETVQWGLFKQHLRDYNNTEGEWIQALGAGGNKGHEAFGSGMLQQFNETVGNLDALSKIQTGEGYSVQKHSHAIVSSRLMFSYLEISMVVVLGLFTLVILSTTDRNIFRQGQQQVWN